MDRDGSGSDRRGSNLTDAVAGSFVLWPGEKGGETHAAAGRVCLPLVVGDEWLGEPLGVGHFDSLVDAKCLPIYAHPYWLSAQCGGTNWSHRAGAHRCSASVPCSVSPPCRLWGRRARRPVQFDGDALDLAVVVKRFDALLPPVHAVLAATEGCLDGVGGPGVGRRGIVNRKITSPYWLG